MDPDQTIGDRCTCTPDAGEYSFCVYEPDGSTVQLAEELMQPAELLPPDQLPADQLEPPREGTTPGDPATPALLEASAIPNHLRSAGYQVHRALEGKPCEEKRPGFTLVCSDRVGLGRCTKKEYTCSISFEDKTTCGCK